MKRFVSLALAATLALAPAVPAWAVSRTGNTWNVTYTTKGKMDETYNAQEYVDQVQGLQPGDDITFTVTLKQENATASDWYMENTVIKTLEEQDKNDDAEGSAYEYLLTYQGPSSSKTLYDSKTVGGDEGQGMHDATDALEDFLFLDNLSEGQTATINLKVSLDGETEGNAYFDTLARLKMRFAVEPVGDTDKPNKPGTPGNRTQLVKTGDETDLFPFYVAMAVSGVGLMALAIYGLAERRREDKEVA